MTRMRAAGRWWMAGLLFVAAAGLRAEEPKAADDSPALARRLFLQGGYAEAGELYTKLVDKASVAAALGLARCQAAVGDLDAAAGTLQAAVAKLDNGVEVPQATLLLADLAQLAFDRGDYDAAGGHVQAAIDRDPNCLPARWIAAELLRVAGKLDEAKAAYKWLYDFYNDPQHEVSDPDDLRAVGLAVAELARWERHADFKTLVNDLYPLALQNEEGYWPAHYESGVLFLEKFNQAEATRSFKSALQLNPNAAEVHAALARLALQNYDLDEAGLEIVRALEINPRLIEAHQLKSDMLAANFQLEEALAALDKARELNPVSEETLGRVASLYAALDGLAGDQAETRFGKLEAENIARNPQCGAFYFTLAERLVELRKYPAAERFYQEAIQRMPQLAGSQAGLGMLYMRLGREVEAQQLLTEAFDGDPAHVRVKNFLEVLDVLAGYAVIETDHFVVKFDRGQDKLLARYAARYLEDEVYPTLTQQFGFEPEGKSLFEIFNKARNTGGHGWFSARMVGLPYVGTVGPAGKMVALASPNGMDQKFNWARVVKHEFVHVLNLQQTGFNIPHWYTEALATLNEQFPRPQIWNELLSARVPKGELFNLDTINLGFIRPSSSLDWQMAYCQAELYAQYMLSAYGDDALARMLAAYADNLNTRDALKRAFNVEQADFEAGYLEHLKQVVAGLSQRPKPPETTLAELDKAHRADPKDADLAARLAYAWFARKAYPKARELARAALEIQPKHQLASYVLARVHLVVGEEDEASALLEGCLDPEAPDENVLDYLARTRLKAGQHAEAARLYKLGAKTNPQDSRWLRGLARVWITAKDDAKLAPVLAQLAEMDADDVTLRQKLAAMALAAGDYPAAVRWANQALQIDVLDPDVHRMAGEALVGLEQFAQASEEYEAAVQLSPGNQELQMALAKSCLRSDRAPRARQLLEAILKQTPDHAEARQLLEGLPP